MKKFLLILLSLSLLLFSACKNEVPVFYFTITFDSNGGSYIEDIVVDQFTCIYELPVPSGKDKDEYIFGGWFNDEDFYSQFYCPAYLSSDRTLYAKWEPVNYEIEYDLKLKYTSHSNPTTYTVETPSFILEEPDYGYWYGKYTFLGWKEEGSSEYKTDIVIEQGTTGNKKFSAVWTDKNVYSITYEPNGGDGDIITQKVIEGESVNIKPSDLFVREGYYFSEWNTSPDGSGTKYDVGDICNIDENITLYAIWEVIKYNIEYIGVNDSDFDGDINPYFYTIETPTFKLNNPVKLGYSFLGWVEEDSTESPDLEVYIEKGSTGDKHFRACWKDSEIPIYTITYHKNRGENESFYVSQYHGISSVIGSADIFNDEGYIFSSWNTKPDGTGINYREGDEYQLNNDLDLYAIWNQDGTGLLEFKLNDSSNTYSVVGIKDGQNIKNIIIPSTYGGKKVTSIADLAFYKCTTLSSVVIEDGITSIGNSAFALCNNLANIEIPDSVSEIKESSFDGCNSLTKLVIPNKVKRISSYTFHGCSSLEEITLPESVTSIGDAAFAGCSSLTSFAIPESVTSIGDSAFEDCGSLTSITIPRNVTSIGDSAFQDCSRLISITIPEGITSIGYSAFENCSRLSSVTIPKSVTKIEFETFLYCYSLTNIIIPETVTEIESYAFGDCSSLTNIIIPQNVTSIGGGAFTDCSSLISIAIPEGVKSINYRTFQDCRNLINVTIYDSIEMIGDYAFESCYKLSTIDYKGTISEWESIDKGIDWKLDCPSFVVKCTDGEIQE